MEAKKNPAKDVQRRYGLHLSIGLMIALALVVTAFEWRTAYEMPITLEEITGQIELVEMPPLTAFPEPPKPKLVMPEIKIVDDKEEVPDVLKTMDIDDVPDIPEVIDNDPPPVEIAPEYVDYADVMPEPFGGMNTFMAYLAKNIKYPRSGQRMGIQGNVFIQFIVDEEGNLTNMLVIKGLGDEFDNESLRVLSKAPKWKPGRQSGLPVKVRMVIPIVFRLQ